MEGLDHIVVVGAGSSLCSTSGRVAVVEVSMTVDFVVEGQADGG